MAAVGRWADDVADFRPDRILVLSTIWDLADRQLAEWDRPRSPGDPDFDDALVARYVQAIDALSATGASVGLMTAPCTNPTDGDLPFGTPATQSAFAPERTQHYNDVLLPRIRTERPEVVDIVDLFALVCPGGEYTTELGGVA